MMTRSERRFCWGDWMTEKNMTRRGKGSRHEHGFEKHRGWFERGCVQAEYYALRRWMDTAVKSLERCDVCH
jgi:hypothetical protein